MGTGPRLTPPKTVVWRLLFRTQAETLQNVCREADVKNAEVAAVRVETAGVLFVSRDSSQGERGKSRKNPQYRNHSERGLAVGGRQIQLFRFHHRL